MSESVTSFCRSTNTLPCVRRERHSGASPVSSSATAGTASAARPKPAAQAAAAPALAPCVRQVRRSSEPPADPATLMPAGSPSGTKAERAASQRGRSPRCEVRAMAGFQPPDTARIFAGMRSTLLPQSTRTGAQPTAAHRAGHLGIEQDSQSQAPGCRYCGLRCPCARVNHRGHGRSRGGEIECGPPPLVSGREHTGLGARHTPKRFR